MPVQDAKDVMVLRKVLDAQRAEGRAAVRLIDAAVPQVDAARRAPPPPGTGTRLDVVV